ncbi:hypothetical protein ABPG74_006951 [Tetrahymena malaccensis]
MQINQKYMIRVSIVFLKQMAVCYLFKIKFHTIIYIYIALTQKRIDLLLQIILQFMRFYKIEQNMSVNVSFIQMQSLYLILHQFIQNDIQNNFVSQPHRNTLKFVKKCSKYMLVKIQKLRLLILRQLNNQVVGRQRFYSFLRFDQFSVNVRYLIYHEGFIYQSISVFYIRRWQSLMQDRKMLQYYITLIYFYQNLKFLFNSSKYQKCLYTAASDLVRTI